MKIRTIRRVDGIELLLFKEGEKKPYFNGLSFVKTTGSTAVSNLLLPNDLLNKKFEQKKNSNRFLLAIGTYFLKVIIIKYWNELL